MDRKAAIALRSPCAYSWEGISQGSFGNGAWGSVSCCWTATPRQAPVLWACTKANWAEGQFKSDKASSWTDWALCFSKSEQKCQIPYKYQAVHSCTDLASLFCSDRWRAESSCSSVSLEDGEILRFCFSKAIICISPQPEAMGHALLSMVKNVSSQHWGKFWNSPGVPGIQTRYRHWQIRMNNFGAL